jgi:hypothetical protein
MFHSFSILLNLSYEYPDNIRMRKFFASLVMLCSIAVFFSCASRASLKPPEKVVRPETPEAIMGDGIVPAEKLAGLVHQVNADIDADFAADLAKYYVEEAAAEGVNHDVAFAQMCLETGFLRFGGDVMPEQFNFCGLGAMGNGEPGLSFPDPQTGVRAHIQHLKAYGSTEPLNNDLVNPRFRFVRRGRAPTIYGLAGAWAMDPEYGNKIAKVLQRMYYFAF